MITGTVFQAKKTFFVMENLEIWVLMGTGVKFVVENAIFRIADPKLPTVFTMQLF